MMYFDPAFEVCVPKRAVVQPVKREPVFLLPVPERMLPAKVNGRWTRVEVLRRTAHLADMTLADLQGDVRSQDVLAPRHVGAFVLVRLLGYSLFEVGFMIKRDHTSILHACKLVDETFERHASGSMKEQDRMRTRLLLKVCSTFELEDALRTYLMEKGGPPLHAMDEEPPLPLAEAA